MENELEQVRVTKILQSPSYTAIVLSSKSKSFAIYSEPSLGKTIQTLITQPQKRRPLTHDFIQYLLVGLEAKPFQVVIKDVDDGIFYSKLFLEEERNGLRHILEIDARPSDCITVALLNNIPILCTQSVIDKAVAVSD